jgi:ferredoxin-NADP reductase
VRFHLLVTARDGKLTLERLKAMIPEWKLADVWFCGPLGFAESLRAAMVAQGFDDAHFHQKCSPCGDSRPGSCRRRQICPDENVDIGCGSDPGLVTA